MKYEMRNGWTIPKSDLKYLKNGPLAAEGLQEVLVQHNIGWRKVKSILDQYGRIITALAATFSIISLIAEYWNEVLKIFD